MSQCHSELARPILKLSRVVPIGVGASAKSGSLVVSGSLPLIYLSRGRIETITGHQFTKSGCSHTQNMEADEGSYQI